jgi:repressor LexA
MVKIAEKDRRVLDYIISTINEKGYSPSVRDIMNELDFKSTSTVHASLGRLESCGYIRREGRKSRTLHIDDSTAASINRIPVIGTVAAGTPILAEESFDEYVNFSVDTRKYDYKNLFALRIKGQSMIGAGIMDGDTVIVDRRDYASNGEIVVAIIDSEATVKRFFKENHSYRLQPENPEVDPIISNSVELVGKVIACFRTY